IRLSGGLPVVGIAASTAFVLALATFTAGLADLYERPVPWRAIGIVFAIGFMVRLGIEGMPRDDLVRQFFYQAPFTAMQMFGAAVIWSTRRRRPVDIVLFTVVA